jgi:hypothetical protein
VQLNLSVKGGKSSSNPSLVYGPRLSNTLLHKYTIVMYISSQTPSRLLWRQRDDTSFAAVKIYHCVDLSLRVGVGGRTDGMNLSDGMKSYGLI